MYIIFVVLVVVAVVVVVIIIIIIFFCIASAETVTQVNGTAIAQPIESPSSHDLQIYGIVLTILLCFIVFGGVKMINRVAPAFLIPVLFSVVCIFLPQNSPNSAVTGSCSLVIQVEFVSMCALDGASKRYFCAQTS